jgi:hypothetical protein
VLDRRSGPLDDARPGAELKRFDRDAAPYISVVSLRRWRDLPDSGERAMSALRVLGVGLNSSYALEARDAVAG